MAKRISQSDHDKMVKLVADWLTANNYKSIKADITGYDSPDKIKWSGNPSGHIPDNTALNSDSKPFIFEVETHDSIDDQHTEDQWKLFSAHAKNNNGEFYVVVPNNSRSAAENRVKSLNITASVWGV